MVDCSKIKQLQKTKYFSTLLLFVAGGLLYISFVFELPCLRAVSEAALVGGIADWFAVVALFRHPLGLPIPHTAIIPKSKDRIAKNLGIFIKSEFFNKENLWKSTFLQKFSLKKIIEIFLEGKSASFSLDVLSQTIESKIPNLYEIVDKEKEGSKLLRHIDFSNILGGALAFVRKSDRYDKIINGFIDDIQEGLITPYIKGKIENSFLYKPMSFFGLDKSISQWGAEKILEEYKKTNSPKREELSRKIDELIMSLSSHSEIRERVNSKIKEVLNSRVGSEILASILEHIQKHKIISTTVADIIKKTLISFINDTKKLTAIERWLKNRIVNIVGDYSDEIAGFIENTIKSWDAQEISQKLELEVGKDLQFIRINGMVVGGFIGGVIYGIERLFVS